MAAVCNVSNYSKSTKLLASTTLRSRLKLLRNSKLMLVRNILGTKTLAELLSEREAIAGGLKVELSDHSSLGLDLQ